VGAATRGHEQGGRRIAGAGGRVQEAAAGNIFGAGHFR
jgi:hypothetical protein